MDREWNLEEGGVNRDMQITIANPKGAAIGFAIPWIPRLDSFHSHLEYCVICIPILSLLFSSFLSWRFRACSRVLANDSSLIYHNDLKS